ncbi:heavy-metal-associated domain-containing protein [Nocardia sp. NPDC056611]|uniref:heavy-metal-associated domain-containing protein n=1 Tax=Nocardia sp. NPDC056611 TaxID=3345877 RepID=UPI0036729CE4
MSTTTVTVTGMTCGCCANSVSKEVGKISGVTGVNVDVDSGRVVVDSDDPIAPGALATAVADAGYALAD